MKKIAILLASYNGIKYIKEQIDSILNQIEVKVTIFISDDSSTDKTLDYLQNIYKDEKRLIYLESNRKFAGAAKNFYRLIKDVDFSDFDYISLSDQDDIWYKNKLIQAIKIIEEKQIDAYSSSVLAFWRDSRKIVLEKAQPQTKYDHLFEAAGPGCTYVFNQKLANNLKEFIIKNWKQINQVDSHDWFIYAYSRENNYKWYIDKKVSIQYRQHSSNQIGANYGLKAKTRRLELIFFSWYRNETNRIIKVLNLENKYEFTKYILNKNYLNNIFLLKYIFYFRRKIKDKILLTILVLLGIY